MRGNGLWYDETMKLKAQHVWLDYDQEADVLYISFRKPPRATNTIETDDDILVRKDGNTIVGLTIWNASIRYPVKPGGYFTGKPGNKTKADPKRETHLNYLTLGL